MAVYVNVRCENCRAFFTETNDERFCVCPVCNGQISLRSGGVYSLSVEAGRIMYAADKAFYARRFDEAAGLYKKAVKTEKNNPAPHYGLALCKHAVAFERRGLAVKPESLTRKGGLYKNGEFKKAVKLAEDDRSAVYLAVARDVDTPIIEAPIATTPENAAKDLYSCNDEFVIKKRILLSYNGAARDVVIPDGIIGIGMYAFILAENLKTVHIPSSVGAIYPNAFTTRDPIERITVDERNTAYRSVSGCLIDVRSRKIVRAAAGAVIPVELADTIGKYAFESAEIAELVIPEGIVKIEGCAFAGCGDLKSVSLPASAEQIHGMAFTGCKALERISVADGNTAFRVENGCLIGNAHDTVIRGAADGTIPRSVAEIGSGAYDGYDMERIVIPASVIAFGEKPFAGCKKLKSIEVENGNAVYESAGNCVLDRADGWLVFGTATCDIPMDGRVTRIDDYAFYGSEITVVAVPEGVTEIGKEAFCGCTELESVKLPTTLEAIADGAFRRCKRLKHICIPASVTEIGGTSNDAEGDVFERCDELEAATFEDAYGWTYSDTDEQIPPEILKDGAQAAKLLRDGRCIYKN